MNRKRVSGAFQTSDRQTQPWEQFWVGDVLRPVKQIKFKTLNIILKAISRIKASYYSLVFSLALVLNLWVPPLRILKTVLCSVYTISSVLQEDLP